MFQCLSFVTLLIVGSLSVTLRYKPIDNPVAPDEIPPFYPSLPFTEQTAEEYASKLQQLWSNYYAGGNIINIINNIYDENVVVCRMVNVCKSGRKDALLQLEQYQTWMKKELLINTMEFDHLDTNDYSITTRQHPLFTIKKPMTTLVGHDQRHQEIEVKIKYTFNKDGLIILVEYGDIELSTLDKYVGSFWRVTAGYKSKKQADHEAGYIDIPPQTVKIFGCDEDVVIVLSIFTSVVVFSVIAIWLCCKLCCQPVKDEKID
eukprot:70399_1